LKDSVRAALETYSVSVMKTRALDSVSRKKFCSEIHSEHTNAQGGQNVEFFGVKPGDRYSDH